MGKELSASSLFGGHSILHARTDSTRTCVHSVKERAEGLTEEALDLGGNKECGWNLILGSPYNYRE